MSKILSIILSFVIGFAIGEFCFHAPDATQLCLDGQSHQWSRWTDDWTQPNGFGYMRQRRYCDKCGQIEFQAIRGE